MIELLTNDRIKINKKIANNETLTDNDNKLLKILNTYDRLLSAMIADRQNNNYGEWVKTNIKV